MQKKWFILIGTGIAGLMIAIDFTIVNASLPSIQHDLQANLKQLQWIIAGFGLTFSALMVTMGRIGDLWGRRTLLYVGVIGFGLASLAAGFATCIVFLIAMRLLQGFLGAAIIPCGLAITANVFPKEEQGRAIGIYSSLVGVGIAIGPMLGSIIDSVLTWRWIFFINVPILLVSLGVCIPILPKPVKVRNAQVDWLGAGLLMFFLASLVFVMNEGGDLGWSSPLIRVTTCFSACLLMAFIAIEKRVATPIIPLTLFSNRGFILAVLVYVATVSFTWPIIFFMPLYLHNVVGLSTEYTGLILAAMTMMTVFAPILAGYLYDKKGQPVVIHLTFLFCVIAYGLFMCLGANGPLILILLAFVIYGSAWGMGNGVATPIALSRQSNTDEAGLTSGALITIMNVVALLALTTTTWLFQWIQQNNLRSSVNEIVIQQKAFLSSLHSVVFLIMIVIIICWCSAVIILNKCK